MPRLLIADDDRVLNDLLADYLRGEDFDVAQAFDGAQALETIRAGEVDLVVLDVMMPKLNGFDTLRGIRGLPGAPRDTAVLMLTARGEDIDRIVGLEMGADDYMPKPANPRELVARIRAILRRADSANEAGSSDELRVGELLVNAGDRSVSYAAQPIDLTSTEFNVLEVLVREAGNVVSKADLTERALGRKLALYDRAADMHISNLRRKLGVVAGEAHPLIVTVRGVGYLYARPD
jgi:two-component system response regulator CpxR